LQLDPCDIKGLGFANCPNPPSRASAIEGPALAGIARAAKERQGLTKAEDACGMFIEWISP